MGKAAMCIKMLQILNTGRVYRISELAELLETNPRNVIEYKKELDELSIDSGFYIDTIPGRYGGYKLNGNAVIPALKLTEKEKQTIIDANNYLLNRNDFLQKKEYEMCISKIMSSLKYNNKEDEQLLIINRFPLRMQEQEVIDRFQTLKKASKEKKIVNIKYTSLKNVEKEYVFHPYEQFMFNNSWFVIGWNERYGDISYLKVNRITSIEVTDKKFTKWKYYKRTNYVDDFGFKNNGEWYHVEFKAFNQYAYLVKERIYGKNQEVIPIDEKSTLVKVDMQNKENILVFVLGFGKNLEVIEPQWLIDEIKEYKNYIVDLYG